MPCGGIEPVHGGAGSINDRISPQQGGCWMCGRGGCAHFCHEWYTYIHARCVPGFLQTEEGEIVMEHEHSVVLRFDLERSSAEMKGEVVEG